MKAICISNPKNAMEMKAKSVFKTIKYNSNLKWRLPKKAKMRNPGNIFKKPHNDKMVIAVYFLFFTR